MNEIKHPVAIWSDISGPILRAMVDEVGGRLPVVAVLEPLNSADFQAVVILLEVRQIVRVFGGALVDFADSRGVAVGGYVRVGYLARIDGKTDLARWIGQQPGVAGSLVFDGELGYRFEWFPDDDILF